MALAASCSGQTAAKVQAGMTAENELVAGLPPIPQGNADLRQVSAAQTLLQNGDAAAAKSAGAVILAPNLRLPAASQQLQWAYYAFNVGAASTPVDVVATFQLEAGTQAWLGFANYAKHRWDLFGPYGTTQTHTFTGGNDFVSPAGNMYALVLAFNGNTVLVQTLQAHYDDNITSYSISGTVLDNASAPIPGSSVTVNPGNQTVNCGANGSYTVPGLASGAYTVTPNATGYTFVPSFTNVPLLNQNVVGVDFTGTAPSGPTYVNDARPFLMTNCSGCHKADKPLLANYTVEAYDSVLTKLSMIKSQVQDNHNGNYSVADKAMIADWVDAGGPLGVSATHYTQVREQIFATQCLNCHSSTLTGGARNGAPIDTDLDTYAAATSWRTNNKQLAKRCNSTIKNDSMPPAGALDASLKALMQGWIDSGWPN